MTQKLYSPSKILYFSFPLQIAGAMQRLAPFLPKSPPDIEALRFYLLLMECTVLDEPSLDKYASCSAVFAQALLALESAGAKVLCKYIIMIHGVW